MLYALTSSDIDRFSNLFHWLNQENICNNTVTKDPTTPQVCRYTTLWNVVGSLATVLLQMLSWFRQWNKFDNRSISDEVKAYNIKRASFLGHPVDFDYACHPQNVNKLFCTCQHIFSVIFILLSCYIYIYYSVLSSSIVYVLLCHRVFDVTCDRVVSVHDGRWLEQCIESTECRHCV